MKLKIFLIIALFLLFVPPIKAQTYFLFRAVVISDSAKLRSNPKVSAKTIRTLEKDTKIVADSITSKNGWYYVLADKTKGWLHGNDFRFPGLSTYYETPKVPEGWFLIGSTNKTDEGFSYYYLRSSIQWNDSDLRKYGLKPDVEFWLRLVPFNSRKYAKKDKLPQNFGYSLEYVMVFCKEKRLSVENKTFYSTKNEILSVRASSSYREPVIPNSLGETVWRKFCED